MAWFYSTVLPRLVYLPYWVACVLLAPIEFLNKWRKKTTRSSPLVCLESGLVGWQLIEYKELYQSAAEFLGRDRVIKIEIDRGRSYLLQVWRALRGRQPTHYLYDPRTSSLNPLVGLFQAFAMAILLRSRGIIPVSILTNLSVRAWRAQAAVVTATAGLTINFLSARLVQPIFPHRRLVGPCLMPLSLLTLNRLKSLYWEDTPGQRKLSKAIFSGSLYEPRTSVLQEIKSNLQQRGLDLEIHGRPLGSPRTPDEQYWDSLGRAAIVVTTVDQLEGDGDWTWVPSLVYRFLEAGACGSLLLAPDIPGVRRYFVPGEHFVAFSNAVEAVDLIEHYLTHPQERLRLAQSAARRVESLLECHAYWSGIDLALGSESFT